MNNQLVKTKKIDALWSHVHWLSVLGSLRSFTAAAQRLGVSKAAMSHRIGELEHAAGVSLVRRTTRSVRLTDAGQQLVDSTQSPFVQIERSFERVKDLAGEPRGVLRVTAPVALGRQQIAPLIPVFLKQYPEVRIELDVSDRLLSLAQEGFDLAIRHVAAVPDTHVAWTLCSTRAMLVATGAYLRKRGTPASPRDLADHDCLHYLRGTETPTWCFEPLKGRKGRLNVAVRGSFAANNSELLREAALGGLGIALLPDFSAAREMAAGRLTTVLPDWRSVGSFGDKLYAIRPYATHVPRSVRAFVGFLQKELAAGFAG